MKKVITITALILCFATSAYGQDVEGTYSNNVTEWVFEKTEQPQHYTFTGYNTIGKRKVDSNGHAFYSDKFKRFVISFQKTGDIDNIGLAVCEVEEKFLKEVTTFNPDGTPRWEGGNLKKIK